MANSFSWILVPSLLLALLGVIASADPIAPGHGFIGYGISLFEPACAFACSGALYVPLNCTTTDLAIPALRRRDEATATVYPSGDGWKVTAEATRTCMSRNEFYLTTLAYCLKTHCTSELSLSSIESFWERELVKLPDGSGPKPYIEVLAGITETPTKPLNETDVLSYTAVLPEELYTLYHNDVHDSGANEVTHSRYSLILLLTGAAIPIAISLLRFLPWPAAWVTRANAYLIDPPLLGSKHSAPVWWGMGIMPTRGQALFILYLWASNIVLSSVGYDNRPSVWYATPGEKLERELANRFGVLCYANVPLVVLYAGRNNFLLWLTNWSHSTFLLLHRWVAFICMMHAVLHSVVYLHIALNQPGWAEEFTAPYWYWGCGSTIGFAVLVVKSIQPIRQRIYEVFLVAHIVITVLVIVSAYKHVNVVYGDVYGYQNWLWIACAIWGFDRLVRAGRWLFHGYKRAYFTPIDEDYYRLDIPGVSAHGHVYLHFPTVSGWRFWENHPFSIAGVTYQHGEPVLSSTMIGDGKEKQVATDAILPVAGPSAGSSSGSESDGSSIAARKETGIAVFIRRQGGLTALLAAKGPQPRGIPVFVEGSYNQKMTFLQEDYPEPTHEYPNLLCVAGGVGITGVLPALDRFNTAGRTLGTKKLFWGARTWPLVREVERMQLDGGHHQGTMTERRWGDVEVTVAVGERFDMKRVLTKELRQQVGGTVVVVCGPAGMVDDVRCIASALGRHNEDGKAVVVKLMVESFTW